MAIFIPAPRKDTFVTSILAKRNFADADSLYAGSAQGAVAVFRSYLKFNLKALPKQSFETASLRLYLRRNELGRQIFDLHPLTESFKCKKISWHKQPAYEIEPAASREVCEEAGFFVEWDITELVKRWHSGALKNRGIIIKARDETKPGLLAFDSGESSYPERRPSLCINAGQPVQAYFLDDRFFFCELQKNLVTGQDHCYSLARDVSGVCFHTFFIKNKSANPASVVAQISMNNSTWLDDSQVSVVDGGANFAVTSTHLARWTRLAYKSADPEKPATLDIWFQCAT